MGKFIPPLAPSESTVYDAGAVVYDSVSGKLCVGDGATSGGKKLYFEENAHAHGNADVLAALNAGTLTEIAKIPVLESAMGDVSSSLAAILGTAEP